MTVRPTFGAVLGRYALNKRALLALRAGRSIAADLPVVVDGPHRALGRGLPEAGQACDGGERQNGAHSPQAAVRNRSAEQRPPMMAGSAHDISPLPAPAQPPRIATRCRG